VIETVENRVFATRPCALLCVQRQTKKGVRAAREPAQSRTPLS
jgi:hypothetical protein